MVWFGGYKKVVPTDWSRSSSFDGTDISSEASGIIRCPTHPADKKNRKSSQTATKAKKKKGVAAGKDASDDGEFDAFLKFLESPDAENNNKNAKSSQAVTKTKKKKKGGVNRYDREVLCANQSIFTLIFLIIASFLTWKYGLKEPQNWEETQEGFQDIWEVASDLWEERDAGNFADVLDGLDDDGFGDLLEDQGNRVVPWDNDYVHRDNGGLHLTLQNALDDTWQSEFEIVVADWQESDALRLTTERVAVDYNCNAVDGVVVVCNANFGDTGWVGINERFGRKGLIRSTVVKMNEYYLRNANSDHRRYIMCHEIGHALGLAHTDENPYNANLENCLDYTVTPYTNMFPGDVNMAKLREMYLTRRLRRVEEDGTVVETTHLIRR